MKTSMIKVETIYPKLETGWNLFYEKIYEPPVIYKNSFGEVRIEGLVNGDWSKRILSLPPGFRPGKRHIFTVCGVGSTFVRVDVLENGDIFVSHDGKNGVNKTGWLALDGIAFYSKH